MNIIVIVGCGGTGSNLAPMLSRMAKDEDIFILVDGDIVTPGNIHRQTYQDFDIGQNKARALAKKLNSCYGVKHYALDEYVNDEGRLIEIVKSFIPNHRDWDTKLFLIACVDNNKARITLEAAFAKLCKGDGFRGNTFYIDSGNEDTYGTIFISNNKNRVLRSEMFDMADVEETIHCDTEIMNQNPQQYQINLDMALAIAKVVFAIEGKKQYPTSIKINGFERNCIFND